MKATGKKTTKAFLSNKEEIKNQAILSLRSSFEIEGIFFTDEEIKKMVNKVRSRVLVKS